MVRVAPAEGESPCGFVRGRVASVGPHVLVELPTRSSRSLTFASSPYGTLAQVVL